MTDMTAFLQGHAPPEEEKPFDHTRKVECRALVRTSGIPRIEITEELTDKICDLVAKGKSMAEIGDMEGMPSYSTLRRWVAKNEEFRTAYAVAKETLADDWLVVTVAIADDASKDYELKVNADDMPVVQENKETLGRSKLRIDTRFRVLAKLVPSKYGDVPAIAAAPAAPAVENRNGDGAKVIDGVVIPFDRHPLYESIEAWGKVAKEAK